MQDKKAGNRFALLLKDAGKAFLLGLAVAAGVFILLFAVGAVSHGFSALAGLELARRLLGLPAVDFPQETAIGALALYISDETVAHFQPMNVNFGIIPPLGYRVKGKRNKNAELSRRSLDILSQTIEQEVLYT